MRNRKNNGKFIHGLTEHPLHSVWLGIWRRCTTTEGKDFELYKKRGVKVCDEWKDFKPFYDWCMVNGWEKGKQIDKDLIPFLNGKEGLLYSPSTCSILTPKENSNCRRNNTFIEFRRKKQNILQWANELGISAAAISQRLLKLKWSVEKTLSTTTYDLEGNIERAIKLYVEGKTIRSISAELKMCRKTISREVKKRGLFK